MKEKLTFTTNNNGQHHGTTTYYCIALISRHTKPSLKKGVFWPNHPIYYLICLARSDFQSGNLIYCEDLLQANLAKAFHRAFVEKSLSQENDIFMLMRAPSPFLSKQVSVVVIFAQKVLLQTSWPCQRIFRQNTRFC